MYRIQKKYFLNGVRYLYSSYITQKLENTINSKMDAIKVIPTGSNNVGSDIDTQIMINVENFTKLTTLKRRSIIKNIISILKDGQKLWGVKSIANSLDINLYPATILNYTSKNQKQSKLLYINVKNNFTCFRPQLSTLELSDDFIRNDYINTRKISKANMLKYYDVYQRYVAHTLYKLTKICNDNIKMPQEDINKYIFELVKYNYLADEVYLSVSSIIMVVWHQQMKNVIRNKKELSVLSVCSFVENYDMFMKTKKEKYSNRYLYALSNIQTDEYIKPLDKKYIKIIRKYRRDN